MKTIEETIQDVHLNTSKVDLKKEGYTEQKISVKNEHLQSEGCNNAEGSDKFVKTENAQRYICNICLKEFTNLQVVTNHKRIHTNEKTYECKQCGNCYKKLKTLKNHTRVHTNENMHECKTCGKRFTFHLALKTH